MQGQRQGLTSLQILPYKRYGLDHNIWHFIFDGMYTLRITQPSVPPGSVNE